MHQTKRRYTSNSKKEKKKKKIEGGEEGRKRERERNRTTNNPMVSVYITEYIYCLDTIGNHNTDPGMVDN